MMPKGYIAIFLYANVLIILHYVFVSSSESKLLEKAKFKESKINGMVENSNVTGIPEFYRSCYQFEDPLRSILGPNDRQPLKDLAHTTLTRSSNFSFLIVGDSLDLDLVTYLCEATGMLDNVTQLTYRKDSPYAMICSSSQSSSEETLHMAEFGMFKIFGMHHRCTNGGLADKLDPRVSETSADRVAEWAATDLLPYFRSPPTHILVSSALWDMSRGCTDRKYVTPGYEAQYAEGIGLIHKKIRQVFPSARLYWKTSPPTSEKYSKKSSRNWHNQKILNDILRETVRTEELGRVVDWWDMIWSAIDSGLISKDRYNDELPDGRHFRKSPCPQLAFFNLWLNVIDSNTLLE